MIKKWDSYDFKCIKRIPFLSKRGGRHRNKVYYIDTVSAFDIETTNIDKYRQAVMYIWQWQINNTTVYGRTWEEFRTFYDKLQESIKDDCLMVVYVHNLSFEFQFLKDIIPIDSVFAMDARKILKFVSGKLEFRCSYLQSNMSLAQFLKQMNVKDQKVKGFNYKKKRYSWTPLTAEELHYCVNDVKGLRQAMIRRLEMHGDNLYTIPLTSTGYSRRLAKKALSGYQKYIHFMLPDVEVMQALRDAFRGGDTHANRHNVNILLRSSEGHRIRSKDISSSYPAVMLSEKYPRQFFKGDPKYLKTYLLNNYACLMYMNLFDLKLKNERFGDPYISKAKCLQVDNPQEDNGRILQADAVRICINEIDLKIILSQYEFTDFEVDKLYIANKAYLPRKFTDLLKQTYAEKTLLKGDASQEMLYAHKKSLFNSYYGMMVQNPIKPIYVMDPETNTLKVDESRSTADLIEEYRRKGWLPYQWGVWVTSYARYKLHEGIACVDPDDHIYNDTDSVKYIDNNYDPVFEKLNARYRNPDLSAPDRNGKIHYIGIYEDDEEYKTFKTLGAKKYAYEDPDGQLHITVSGVNKKLGPAELKNIKRFKEGFIFRKAGGTESIFNDHPEIKEVRIQGHTQKITSNVMIRESTYTLSLTMEYKRLLAFLANTDIRKSLHYERII